MSVKKQQKNKSKQSTSKPATTENRTRDTEHETGSCPDVRSDNQSFLLNLRDIDTFLFIMLICIEHVH
jgi:hypothetical protein